MKRYRFDKEVGKDITKFDSKNVLISPITRLMEESIDVMQIACMHLERDGLIGGHEAVVPQMFIVLEGEGIVKGGDREPHRIQKGQLAMWEAGEWHETSSKDGLTAIVVESDRLKPFSGLQELTDEEE
ncbi:cupin domain-containing protein [Guptibacillus algicola]|uniref:cupin domain-containing protein n=1 Tax=Guptibacillus algicola TaxID=225844 RepID=UPI001CD5701C|nr:cupin domain-containing protein [Alkalihalobacillus algicola]MCA0988458.1 cupin domain-containing protein [Alkalihalobacillus algicola]